jgi:predicted secreted acid phosphatase
MPFSFPMPRSWIPCAFSIPLLTWILTLTLYAGASAHAAEPTNLGDLESQLITYHDFGGYEHDLHEVAAEAKTYVRLRAKKVSKPALVLDIDETALSNWPKLLANQFAYFPEGPCEHLPKGPCGESAWESLAQDEPILATLDLFKATKAAGVSVFFITGRGERFREATEKNLRSAGYLGWERVIMRPEGTSTRSAADFKAPARKDIEDAGYTIIANVGDQPSDLLGGHAERAFLLPDPYYRIP